MLISTWGWALYSVAMFAIGQPSFVGPSVSGLVARAEVPMELASSSGPTTHSATRSVTRLVTRSVTRSVVCSGLGDPLNPPLHGAGGGYRSPVSALLPTHIISGASASRSFPSALAGPRGIVFVPGRLTWSGGVLLLSLGP